MTYAYAYIAAFATALFYGVSAVIEDGAAKRIPISGASGKRAALRVTASPVYVLGMALSVVAWASSLVALHTLPLFAVQSIAASSIGVVVLITLARTGHAPSAREGALLLAMGVGLVALAVSAATTHAPRTGALFRWFIWIGVIGVAWAAVRASHIVGNRAAQYWAPCRGSPTVAWRCAPERSICTRIIDEHARVVGTAADAVRLLGLAT